MVPSLSRRDTCSDPKVLLKTSRTPTGTLWVCFCHSVPIPPSLPAWRCSQGWWHCHTGPSLPPFVPFLLPAGRSGIVCMCTRVFEGGRNPNCILLKYYDFFPPSLQAAAPPRCRVQLAPTGTCKVVLQVLHQKSFDTVSVIKCTIKRMSAIKFNQSVNQIYICKGFLKGLSSKPPLCF